MPELNEKIMAYSTKLQCEESHFDLKEYLAAAKILIKKGHIMPATGLLGVFLRESERDRDEAYYLLGNAYRKTGNWQLALNNYRRAVDINPSSPAAQAATMLRDILAFYNKDMYNH